MATSEENDLEWKYHVNSRRADWGGIAPLVGLGLELAYVVFDAHKQWADVAANILVFGGVAAEVHFGRIAKIAADKLLAQSKAQTVEAQLELERLRRKVGPRSLDGVALLRALEGKQPPPFPLEILYTKDDEEVWLLANQIFFVLREGAKWPAQLPQPIPTGIGHPMVPTAVWVGGQMSGVAVVEDAPHADDQSTLGGALRMGLFPSFGRISWGLNKEMPVGAIRIIVAPKPP